MPVRSFDPSETVVSRRGRMETPLLATIWLGVAAFSAAEGGIFHLFLTSVAVGINWLVVRKNRELYISRLFVNLGVLAATVILGLELIGTRSESVVALGHYLILIQLCKLFERKHNRDYVQLVALSLLLVVAGAVVSSGLWFALLVLLHMGTLCYSVMVFTLKRGLDSAARAQLSTEDRPMAPDAVAWNVMRDWPAGPLRKRLAVILTAMVLTGVLMFLVAPRSAWSTPGTPNRRSDRSGPDRKSTRLNSSHYS